MDGSTPKMDSTRLSGLLKEMGEGRNSKREKGKERRKERGEQEVEEREKEHEVGGRR